MPSARGCSGVLAQHLPRRVEAGKEAADNAQRITQIRQTDIGSLDPVTLVSRPKLILNHNSYCQDDLVPLGHLPKRGFRASEHLLRKAFEWFDKRIGETLKQEPGDPGRRLAQLTEDLTDRLFFTVITVTDELNAYKVFETLNARGVRLSATDLLKNDLFSLLDRGGENDHELRSLEGRWESMVGRLGAESFPDFLRVHWNSRRPFARQAELFKTIRGQVKTREAVFQLLRDMEEDLDTYLALSSPEVSDWSRELKALAGTLRTFNVRQPFPLLLSARRRFAETEFAGLLRAVVVISLRYNIICGYSPAEQERTYNAVAERIARGELLSLSAALTAMTGIYPDDAAFRAAFADKSIRTTQSRNNRVVRFILCALERHLVPDHDYDFTSDAFTLEHVLPQNPLTGWDGFTDEEAETLVYRLGNLTLMQAGTNRDLGNAQYPAKRMAYAESGFAITRRLAQESAEWTPERIAARQVWMANQATSIWRIAQLA